MISYLAKRCSRLTGLRGHLARLHKDERGVEGLEILLIVVAIVLPLLAIIIWFRDDLKEWVKGVWDAVRGKGEGIDVENPY